jgi:hypothetical protein
MRRSLPGLVVTLLAGCGQESPGALESADPLDDTPIRVSHVEPGLPPAPAAESEPAQMFPVKRPPPFSPGIFPCSDCHVGGEERVDTRPVMPHKKHLDRDLVCADCHAPDDEEADPKVPDAALCLECHEDLAEEPEAVRKYFASIKTEAGTYGFPRRWKMRDTIANHRGHAKAEVRCEQCHGEATDAPFTKPKAVVLMQRCIDCHTKEQVATECKTCHEEDPPPRHGIVLHHAEDQRGCLDCHDEENRDVLHLVNGTKVPFTESYRLCGQCHGPKFRDWKAGLHGKRTGRWDGRRDYYLCVHCHRNPHAPRFPAMTPDPPPIRPEDVK